MALEPRSQVEAEGRHEEVVAGALCLLLAFGAFGCAPPTPAEAAQKDMQVFKRESSVERLVERGRGFAAVGDYTRAEEYLAAALEQGADARKILPELLEICVHTGKFRSAIQHAENHLRRHPDDVRTRFVVATLYAALNETKEAKKQLQTVVEVRPNEAKAHYALGVLARDADQDVVAADRHFREYLRIEPNGDHAEEARGSLLKKIPNPAPPEVPQ
jgi:tetratricopeptide (TPR) repeat protein